MVKFKLGDLVVPLTGQRRGVCGYVTKEEEPGKSRSRVTVTFTENKYGSFLPKNVEAYAGAYAPSYLASDKIYEFWSQCRGVCKIKGKEPWHTSVRILTVYGG